MLYIFIASLFLISCGSNDDDSLGFDKIIGAWKLVSNREDSAETVTDCTKKNTFNFTSKGILTRNLYVEVNSVCNSAQQEIAGIILETLFIELIILMELLMNLNLISQKTTLNLVY